MTTLDNKKPSSSLLMRSASLLPLLIIVAAILFAPAAVTAPIPPSAMEETYMHNVGYDGGIWLSAPSDMVIQRKDSSPPTPLVYSVRAEDDVDGIATLDVWGKLTQDYIGGDILISCTPPSLTTLEPGNHIVECRGQDTHGYVDVHSFKVSVVLLSPSIPADAIAPSLTVPGDIVLDPIPPNSEELEEIVFYDVSATDNADGTATLDRNNGLTQADTIGGSIGIACYPPSGNAFSVENHTVSCSAIDSASNVGTASFAIKVFTSPTTTAPPGSQSSPIATLQAENTTTTVEETAATEVGEGAAASAAGTGGTTDDGGTTTEDDDEAGTGGTGGGGDNDVGGDGTDDAESPATDDDEAGTGGTGGTGGTTDDGGTTTEDDDEAGDTGGGGDGTDDTEP